jgi:hypothetical protein
MNRSALSAGGKVANSIQEKLLDQARFMGSWKVLRPSQFLSRVRVFIFRKGSRVGDSKAVGAARWEKNPLKPKNGGMNAEN